MSPRATSKLPLWMMTRRTCLPMGHMEGVARWLTVPWPVVIPSGGLETPLLNV